MLMTAERGDVVPERDVQEFLSLARNCVTVRVPNAGHMIPWDNEDGFYSALGDFLGASVA